MSHILIYIRLILCIRQSLLQNVTILSHKRQTTKDEIDNLQTCFFIMVFFYGILMVIYRSILFIVLSVFMGLVLITGVCFQSFDGIEKKSNSNERSSLETNRKSLTQLKKQKKNFHLQSFEESHPSLDVLSQSCEPYGMSFCFFTYEFLFSLKTNYFLLITFVNCVLMIRYLFHSAHLV